MLTLPMTEEPPDKDCIAGKARDTAPRRRRGTQAVPGRLGPGWWALQTVCLQGRLTGLGGEDLPTIVIVAHYDAFGVAPVSMCVPGAEGSSCLWLIGRKEKPAKGKGAPLSVREPQPKLPEPSPGGHTDHAEFPPRDGPPSGAHRDQPLGFSSWAGQGSRLQEENRRSAQTRVRTG